MNDGPPALRSNDFAAAKFFRVAERERKGGTGGVAPPFRLGRAGRAERGWVGRRGANVVLKKRRDIS